MMPYFIIDYKKPNGTIRSFDIEATDWDDAEFQISTYPYPCKVIGELIERVVK